MKLYNPSHNKLIWYLDRHVTGLFMDGFPAAPIRFRLNGLMHTFYDKFKHTSCMFAFDLIYESSNDMFS